MTLSCFLGLGVGVGAGCSDNGGGDGQGGSHAEGPTGKAAEHLVAPQVCIAIQRGLSGTVADTLLANKTPAANYGTSAALLTGLVSATQRESLLRFDLSAIPSGATINSAILSLYQVNQGQADIKVHRVTAAWNETTVTWQSFNQAFDATNQAVFTNALNPASTNALVPLVQTWVNGAQPNFGLLLEQPYFGTNITQFQSSESPTVAQRPRLDVCYTVTCAAGFADCDGKGQNGCETAITTTTNCGACGAACAFANAAPACVAGSCGIASCNAGFGDCDGKAATGCETSLATAKDCGGCGIACSAANGTSSCANGTCALLGCNSGFFDCDGNPGNGCEALPCGNAQHCGHGTDCASGVCQNGICAAPTCTDGVQNGAESSTDCGGTTCPPCNTGLACLVGSDCVTGVCRSGVCAAASCVDSVKNGSESGVDCGGPSCALCADGNGCSAASDCQGSVCVGGVCATPVCNDGVKNGSETGVDCGGASCGPCADGIGCLGGADCKNQVCVNTVCQMASCTDGVKNGAESDVDCGGTCGPCGVAELCATSADCTTGVCNSGHCQPPSCSDGVQNGNETGLDCGGACFVAEICDGVDNDCNGTVDDGLGTTTCGIGACQVTVPLCTSGSATACVPGTPGVEICDGQLDDDCDGTVDNGCACTNGQVQSCYTGSAATNSVGTCHSGSQTCVMGQWAACTGEQLPVAEACDGLDNDCNGQSDDALGSTICGVGTCQTLVQNCVAGQVQTCTPGKPGAETCDGQDNDCNGQVDDGLGTIQCGLGACAASAPACMNGVSGVCVAGSPTTESCDGIDNDCDGAIDNGNPGGGLGCATGSSGACSAGTTVCSNGGITCHQTTQPSAESCDGIDNDCDGAVDNGNPGGGLGCNTGHLGICAAGTTVCSSGQVTCSQNAQPGVESCNDLDDNCDGVVDNGNPGGGQSCNTGLLGACSGGTTSCTAGQIACNQNVQPTAEVCDGLIDNNCNGQNDEGCNCVNGSTQSCYAGASGTAGVGACHTGTQTCVNGNFGACVGQVIPTAETCDGVDNNCNGQVDDGLGTLSCGVGQCGNTVAACVNGQSNTCTPRAASAEICDGLDNDCDGVVDNGNPGSGAACGTGKPGVCSAGTTACTTGAIVCNQTTAPSTETCDGLDNDCNGVIDNGNPGGSAACSTGQQGICAGGTTACTAGAVVCNRNSNPTTETCDGLDNDCNGVVDNGNPSGGVACSTGQLGVCAAGVTACTSGAVLCNRTANPSTETCDGLDNDCNGVVDNGNPGSGAACSTGKLGICAAGTTACTAGAIACNQAQTAKTETCNGLDDDCNGVVDNGNPGSGVSCSTGQSGICSAGTTACAGGAIACNRNSNPTTETCDGLDNDCNGVVDNGNPGGGVSCATGQSGICSAGTTSCVSGAVACNRNQNPAVETCNGLDDNCNGAVDENNPGAGQACSTGLSGTCASGSTACAAGSLVCNQTPGCAVACTPGVDCAPLSYKLGQAPVCGTYCYYDELHAIAINGAGQGSNQNGYNQYATGQLIDGKKGSNSWPDDLGSGHAYEWVGWSGIDPDVTFKFATTRLFTTVTVGISNYDPPNVSEPLAIQVSFSTDGTTFSAPVSFSQAASTLPTIPSAQRADLTLNLNGYSGSYVKLTFAHAPNVVFLDEVSFGASTVPAGLGTQSNPGTSCLDLLNQGASTGDGVYWINPRNSGAFQVYCDMTHAGGGWTLLENSVGSVAGTTAAFWNIPYASRFGTFGTSSLTTNWYAGSLYGRGTEYRDEIVDLNSKSVDVLRATASGIDTYTMAFVNPRLIAGNNAIYLAQFATGWSSPDFDADISGLSCAGAYSNVTQHYSNCWMYNLGSDADVPVLDGGWGPHLDSPTATSLGLSSDGSHFTRVKRISRWVRWSELGLQAPPSTGTQANPGVSCRDILQQGGSTGDAVYWVAPAGQAASQVFCDMTHAGGGWALLENSVGSSAGTTTAFWNIPYASRLLNKGGTGLGQNVYNGALYKVGTEYRDEFVDLRNKSFEVFRATTSGINQTTMAFVSPALTSGNSTVYSCQFASGWSSADHDADPYANNCAPVYSNVTQNYCSCWEYNLGSDADAPLLDAGWGPHVYSNVATALGLATDGSQYTRLNRITRWARW